MSKGSGDYVADGLYAAHLTGDQRKYAKNTAGNRTALIQRMLVRQLTEMATNRFAWVNLPEGIDPRFLEMTLFYRALAVFFKDGNNDGYFVARGSSAGPWDLQDNPTKFTVIGNQFGSRVLSADRTFKLNETTRELEPNEAECVPIWANYLRTPDLDVVLIYASKLAELDITIEINSKNARRTKIILADENQRLSAVNINRMLDNGDTLIPLAEGATGLVPTAVDMGIDVNAIEKLHILRVRLWNECMSALGIDNANQDKKERLVADEVDANNAQVEVTKAIALNERRDAAERINKLYKMSPPIEVHYRTDLEAKAAADEAADRAQAAAPKPVPAEKPKLEAAA